VEEFKVVVDPDNRLNERESLEINEKTQTFTVVRK
jgi:hypothetical protein